MEGTLLTAKDLFKNNFIGVEELNLIADQIGISRISFDKVPPISFEIDTLKESSNTHILIFGWPYFLDDSELTLTKMRKHIGFAPDKSEPCFYNQDWYLKEHFANNSTFQTGWYLLRKTIDNKTRGKVPEKSLNLPSALLSAYTFFAHYFLNKELLWKDDYIWSSDRDSNQDMIYVGRYEDSKGMNKNGFSIHRHLTITDIYGVSDVYKS